jgi:hypothetical protein
MSTWFADFDLGKIPANLSDRILNPRPQFCLYFPAYNQADSEAARACRHRRPHRTLRVQ